MPDDAALATVRAAVEAIVPSVDGDPGAADLNVHEHVVANIEKFLPGFVDLLVTLLHAYATDVRAGASFGELTIEERQQVFRAMSLEESPDMQDIIDGLLVFTYGGMYSEWTGFDHDTRRLDPPKVWADVGYHGPVRGHPEYRQDV